MLIFVYYCAVNVIFVVHN